LTFESTVTGPTLVPALSISQPITSISGILAVLNMAQGTPGRNIETDDQLRYRQQTFKNVNSFGTIESMASRLLQEIPYVNSVSFYENTSSIVDSYGRPPHSFELVVNCPSITEQTVANKIWLYKPAGIATFGNVSYLVSDTQGNLHRMYFSKPVNEYVYIKATITRSTEIRFPLNGAVLVANAILAFGNTLIMGQDLINQQFMGPIYSVAGVGLVDLQFATTTDLVTPPVYESPGSNIVIQPTQLTMFDISRIYITIVT
jgi:uncharacterized phage protein gp47/JayE